MSADESPERYRDPEAWPYTFELLDLGALFIDSRYQRPVSRMADAIAGDLQRVMLGALLVSRRDDTSARRYAIVDGQNRWEGMRRIGERWAWCQVLDLGPEPARAEALLFAALQKLRKNITPVEEFKAEEFGGNEEAVMVGRLLASRGVYVTNASGFTAPPDALGAISEVRNIYRRGGEARLTAVLDTAIAAWPDGRGRFQGEVIGALNVFYGKVEKAGDAVDQPRLLRALSEPTLIGSPLALKQKSAARRSGGVGLGGGSFVYTVQVIEEAYRAAGRGRFARKQ